MKSVYWDISYKWRLIFNGMNFCLSGTILLFNTGAWKCLDTYAIRAPTKVEGSLSLKAPFQHWFGRTALMTFLRPLQTLFENHPLLTASITKLITGRKKHFEMTQWWFRYWGCDSMAEICEPMYLKTVPNAGSAKELMLFVLWGTHCTNDTNSK